MVLALTGCGEKESDVTIGSEKAAMGSVDDFLKAKQLSAVNCDGQGNDYSGTYEFTWSNGIANCEGNAKSGERNKKWIPYMRTLECTQSDAKLNCNVARDPAKTLSGCVGKDGRFKLSSESDLGFLSTGISTHTSGNVKIDKEINKTYLTGTLESSQGMSRFATITYAGKLKTGCIIDWSLDVKETSIASHQDLIDSEAESLVEEREHLEELREENEE